MDPYCDRVLTKWVEAIALKRVSKRLPVSVGENFICRFGIPRNVICKNGTPFVNSYVRRLYEQYGVDYVKSSLYHPQGNG